MDHPPTEEQDRILDAVSSSSSNLMIRAMAGCGKTSTLQMIATAAGVANLLVCFNKAIADEASRRLPNISTCRTFNSLGHKVWAAACAHRLTLDKQKIYNIFRDIVTDESKGTADELWERWELIRQGVDLARALGYIPGTHNRSDHSLCTSNQLHMALDEDPDDLTQSTIDRILLASITLAYRGSIDFADQCYMPALFAGTFPKFPLVLIDEYQDLSPINHAIVVKLCKFSRQIGVGDEAQAIYGFRGASTSSMRDAIAAFSMETYPLSLSFRCPSKIVHNVRWRVPTFRASREGGSVNVSSSISDHSAVICRNNAPLIAAAIRCLKAGHSISVAGSDIGHKLVKIMTKLGPETMDHGQSLNAIYAWAADKTDKGSKSAPDMAECMVHFVEQSSNLGSAISLARSLFAQTGTITFWTGHKSKGLEFERVYHLDQYLLADRHRGQDANINYVIDTRSSDKLIYINSEEMECQ